MPDTKYSSYIGRFAPSPTGPLHMGSLAAALASFLDARANKGLWLLRIEDLDPPRESQEAASSILKSLESLHLHWDQAVLYQSSRHTAYTRALDTIENMGLLFPCECSRQEIEAQGGLHSGKCQPTRNSGLDVALRCLVRDEEIRFEDIFQGLQSQHLQKLVGDFVLKRKDGLFAYQLAVVIDDAFQGITHVIRGIDLLDSTARQIYLQNLLGLNNPAYGHFPVIVNKAGQKLSKQHHATPINNKSPVTALLEALDYLQQDPDPQLEHSSPADIVNWAVNHWNRGKLQGLRHIISKE